MENLVITIYTFKMDDTLFVMTDNNWVWQWVIKNLD